jgi:membrane protein YdbS with pleckstrin-like domain
MSFQTGFGLVAAGAVLTWALDVDLPYIEDDALGAVLLLAGVVALVAAALMRAQRPGASPDTGLLMILVGASLLWALRIDVPYVSDAGLGVILLLGGVATVAAAVALNRPRTQRRQVVYRS